MSKKIYVEKAFTLQHEGKKHEFPVGNHTVSADVAEHWYVQAHIGQEPVTDPDTSAATEELLAELEGKARELDKQHAALAEREKAADQREADLNARAEAMDAREAAIAEREKAADASAKQTGKK